MLKDFFPGFIKIHILYHASKEPIYGVEIREELARHGYQLSPGTLYPTLQRLETEGYLTRQPRVVAGRARNYYTITKKGKTALAESRSKIRELVTEVIEEK
ncbi:MAG: helix-turn-helix transcriptional regulator [Chloroflexi bacterium]|nr:helix-turn-helix transcriptional regulator [Chloroflexota bacterium]